MKVISSLARVLQKVVGIGFFFIWVEVRFFNFATNKGNCDWLTLILKMEHFNQNNYQNKTINTQTVSALRSQQVQELENFINITYGLLDNIFQILDTDWTLDIGYWILPVTQVIPCSVMLSKKKWKWYCQFFQKNPIILREKLKIILKKPQMTLKSYIQISQRTCGCFLPKSRYHNIYFRKLFQF